MANKTIADYLDLEDEVVCLTSSVCTENRTKRAADIIKRADVILEGICENQNRGIDELTLDLKIIKASGNIIHEEVLKFSAEKDTYNVETFAKRLLKHVGIKDDDSKWNRLLTSKPYLHSLGIPQSDFVNGSFEYSAPDPKPPSQRKPKAVQLQGPVKAPEKIAETSKTEEGSEIIQAVKEVILKEYDRQGKKPICYFALTCDPRDFGTTIDNMFQISFLVRDCFIQIINGENGLLYVKPLSKREKQSSKFEEQEPRQTVMSINMNQWEKIIKVFKIKKPMIDIPRRYESHEVSKSNDCSSDSD